MNCKKKKPKQFSVETFNEYGLIYTCMGHKPLNSR